jgi:hypothetical protein
MARTNIALALQKLTPDAIELVEELTEEAIAEFERLLLSYNQGEKVEGCGWLDVIETKLIKMGVPPRLAFGMASARDEAKTR